MAIKFDAPAAAGGTPERLNRQGARARQERWLAQLQDALFVAGDEPAAQQHGPARRQEAAADAARQPGAADDARPQPQAGAKAQHGAAPAQAVYGGASPAGMPAGAAAAAGGAAASGIAGAAAVAANSRGATLAAAVPVAPEPAMAAPGALAAALPAAKSGAAAAQDKPGQAAAEQPGDPAAGGGAAEEAEAYAPRLLRLLPDGQGMQAWLRDASLQPAQVAAVAAALAGELAAAGQPLAGLSINGKPLPASALRSATDQARRSAFHAYTAGAQLAPVQPGKA